MVKRPSETPLEEKKDFSFASGYHLQIASWLVVGAHVYLPFSVLVPVWFEHVQALYALFWLLILHKNRKAVSQMSLIKLDSAMLTVLEDQNSMHCYENSKVKK